MDAVSAPCRNLTYRNARFIGLWSCYHFGDNKAALPVRLIRGGDKGVLFFSLDTKKVRFLRWESIKQIETGSPPSGLDLGVQAD